MRKNLLLLIIVLVGGLTVFANPQVTVTGTVYGKDTKSVIVGATIRDLKTDKLTTTDLDGLFVLVTEEGSKLEINAVGYPSTTVKVKGPDMTVYLSKTRATRFAVKPYVEIGAYSGSEFSNYYYGSGITGSAKSNNFGLDLGYTFLNKKNNTLEINVGVAYDNTRSSFDTYNLNYTYDSPSFTDVDGVPYRRTYNINYMHQKAKLDYLTLPIYLSYGYRVSNWLALHVDVGLKLHFALQQKMLETSALFYTYGTYPEFNDLVIDNPAMNEFGYWSVSDENLGYPPTVNNLYTTFMGGIGFEFFIYGPVSLEVGARYNLGLTDIYVSGSQISSIYDAPIFYTNYSGTQANSLSDYFTKSKLSQLSVRAAINFRF